MTLTPCYWQASTGKPAQRSCKDPRSTKRAALIPHLVLVCFTVFAVTIPEAKGIHGNLDISMPELLAGFSSVPLSPPSSSKIMS